MSFGRRKPKRFLLNRYDRVFTHSVSADFIYELGCDYGRSRSLFNTVPLRVFLAGFLLLFCGLDRMSMGYQRVVCCSFVVAGFVELGGFLVMLGCQFVVFCRFLMMLLRSFLLRCFLVYGVFHFCFLTILPCGKL